MKILVVDHAGSFSLVPRLIAATTGKHEIVTMATVQDDRNWSILRAVDPDVVLCEWGDRNAAVLSERLPEIERKIPLIVRLHGYESHDWFVARIRWENVSRLVTVSPWFQRMMLAKVGGRTQVECIPNGVDLDRFQISDRPGRNTTARVAWLGYLNMKKGPALLRAVAESMPDRQFDVGGVFQCENTERILRLGPLNLHLDGWVDPATWLPGHGWILSTSCTESFSYAVAEGMACGLTPLVFSWPGADELWPPECCWRSFDDLRQIEQKDPPECRQWVEERYSADLQTRRFIELLESVAA